MQSTINELRLERQELNTANVIDDFDVSGMDVLLEEENTLPSCLPVAANCYNYSIAGDVERILEGFKDQLPAQLGGNTAKKEAE